MATTKKMTELQALTLVELLLESKEVEGLLGNLAEEIDVVELLDEMGFTPDELLEKIKHMRANREKKREKDPNAPKTKSKARIENEALAVQAAEAMAAHGGEGVGSKWVMEHVPYITSTQRVTSVMKVANELGLVESTKDEKGKVLYLPIV